MVQRAPLASFAGPWEMAKLAKGYMGSAYLPREIMKDSVQVMS
jgi:hypothetical protein